MVILHKIWPVRDLNSRPPAHEAFALTVRLSLPNAKLGTANSLHVSA